MSRTITDPEVLGALHREQQEEIAASERRRAERTSKRRYTSGR